MHPGKASQMENFSGRRRLKPERAHYRIHDVRIRVVVSLPLERKGRFMRLARHACKWLKVDWNWMS